MRRATLKKDLKYFDKIIPSGTLLTIIPYDQSSLYRDAQRSRFPIDIKAAGLLPAIFDGEDRERYVEEEDFNYA